MSLLHCVPRALTAARALGANRGLLPGHTKCFVMSVMKKTKFIVFLLILAATFYSRFSMAYSTKCSTWTSSVKWGYCVSSPSSGAAADHIIYLFHPAMMPEAYFRTLCMFQKVLEEKMLNKPIFVTVSIYDRNLRVTGKLAQLRPVLGVVTNLAWAMQGRTWILSDEDKELGDRNISGLRSVFINEIMPEIENKILHVQPIRRDLLGVSLGGFNAMQLLLNPSSALLFRKAVLIDPILPIANPFEHTNWNQFYLATEYVATDISNPKAWKSPKQQALQDLHSVNLSEKTRVLRKAKMVQRLFADHFSEGRNSAEKYLTTMDPQKQLAQNNGPIPKVLLYSTRRDLQFHPARMAWAEQFALKFPGKIDLLATDLSHGMELTLNRSVSENVANFLLAP